MEKDYIDLLTLQSSIRYCLEDTFTQAVWVRAEIISVSVKGGHCYLELCQNGPQGITAKARAVIWRSKYYALESFFREATGSTLKPGMGLLLHAAVNFSEVYGLSLVVDDLDPQFTLGEKELLRRQCIAKLEADGLMDAQRKLDMAALPYRLAVVSAEGAAGYGDFCRHLHENDYGFVLETELFDAVMQGVNAPASIIDALDRVESSPEGFDAVLILRGGGSSLDLDCFDDYGLCHRIASCSTPVLTAIGHDRDHHIADMVAYESLKTPTALADFFLDIYIAEDERISSFSSRLHRAFINKIAVLNSKLDVLAARIKSADPRNILSRGYVLPADGDGHVLKSVKNVHQGDRIRLLFSDGRLDCEVLEATSQSDSKQS
jgi:exodeoxyribonuclease VII large subunit